MARVTFLGWLQSCPITQSPSPFQKPIEAERLFSMRRSFINSASHWSSQSIQYLLLHRSIASKTSTIPISHYAVQLHHLSRFIIQQPVHSSTSLYYLSETLRYWVSPVMLSSRKDSGHIVFEIAWIWILHLISAAVVFGPENWLNRLALDTFDIDSIMIKTDLILELLFRVNGHYKLTK